MRDDKDSPRGWLFIAGVVFSLLWILGTCSGCTSLSVEYEHVSHPFAGPPFGPRNEEDTIDHINACAVREWQVSERLNAYGSSCVGYLLTDGGFYGPSLTGTLRTGLSFRL